MSVRAVQGDAMFAGTIPGHVFVCVCACVRACVCVCVCVRVCLSECLFFFRKAPSHMTFPVLMA